MSRAHDVVAAGRAHGPVVHDDGTVTFRLWAPKAEQVDLVLDGARQPLPASADPPTADDGWRSARVAAVPGARYGYSLDGGPVRPDPAGAAQPDGVHELSAVVDPLAFTWSVPDFQAPPVTSGAVYELHIGTFTAGGTFAAAAARLGALADLGVTHVEVMPVNTFNGVRGWGYDGVGWYAVHEPYGGPAAFAAFVDAAHREGLAVILDVVYNHLGPSGSYLGEFAPYLTDRYTTPWGDAPNVDGPGADAVRAFILDNVRWWLDAYRVDGLRLDAVHGIVDIASEHLLAQMSREVAALAEARGRRLELVAETDRQDPQTVRPREAGGLGLDAQWLDDLHHALHVALTGEDDGYYRDYRGLPDVAQVYAGGYAFDGRRSIHRGRTVGRPVPPDVSSRRFVTCVQNHDQVGNRALGERLTVLTSPARLRVAIALLCCSPTTPMLFMGDEFAATTPFLFFSSHPEPELDEAVREGRRAEFATFGGFETEDVPDPQDASTAERSRLDWTEADTSEGRARRRLWADLLALRRSEPALATGDRDGIEVVVVDAGHIAVRRAGPPDLVVAANLADEPWSVPIAADLTVLWSSDDPAYGGAGRTVTVDRGTVTVPSETAVLLG